MKKQILTSSASVKSLCKQDPIMAKLVSVVGDLTIPIRTHYFHSLVRSMVGQQISVAAANSIYKRLNVLMNGDITAEKILTESKDTLRSTGLSMSKIRYLRDLSHHVTQDKLSLSTLGQFNNKEIKTKLTNIKGIGKWTAEMFLIFSLGRMDVLPIDDIGIQRGAKWLYQTDTSDRRKILINQAPVWDPHFTIASFYLWEVVHLDFEKRFDSIDDIV